MSRCNLLYWPPEYTGSASYNSFVFVLFLLNCYQSEMSFLNHTNCPKPAQRLYFSSVFWDCPGASFQQDLPIASSRRCPGGLPDHHGVDDHNDSLWLSTARSGATQSSSIQDLQYLKLRLTWSVTFTQTVSTKPQILRFHEGETWCHHAETRSRCLWHTLSKIFYILS